MELAGVGFRYRVEATRQRVVRERLERQDAAARSPWLVLIDRDAQRGDTILHERLGAKARRDQIVEDTRENALILSRAAERNVDIVSPVFGWFSRQSIPLRFNWDAAGGVALGNLAKKAAGDEELLGRLSLLMRDADTGIVGLRAEPFSAKKTLRQDPNDNPPGSDEDQEVRRFAERVDELIRDFLKIAEKYVPQQDFAPWRFFTQHKPAEGDPVRFEMHEESAGTQRFLHLLCDLLQICENGQLMAVDELQSSLHPHLARRVIQMAHSPEFSQAGAQLLFTTHDATLLDPDLLRRDQIVLTQKGSDGAAECFSLWDFADMPRNNAAWARNYLAGRFGGVPVFGPSLADIAVAEGPTPVRSSASEESEEA